MSIEAFESVIKVHLMGSFYVSHAAARLFREQESGSFVHFTSTSGLVGNFGQANYAAAKLGIVGLSKSIALDMNRFNVRSNCVSPFAWSRLIGTIPTETEAEKARVAKIQQMGPEKIAPVVRLSCSAMPPRTSPGRSLRVRMNEIFLMSQSRPLRSVHRGEGWTPQTIAEHAHAGAEIVVLQARPLRRRFQLGCDLRRSEYRSISGCSARFMPDCGQMISSQQKNWEEIMTTPLTFPEPQDKGGSDGFGRRNLLKARRRWPPRP